MKLVLNSKADGKELIVESNEIKILEASKDADGLGSHLVFSENLGRVVSQSPAAIASAMGVVAVKDVPASVSLMSLAKPAKKR